MVTHTFHEHLELLVKELQDLLDLSFEDYCLEQKDNPGSRYTMGVIVGMGYSYERLLELLSNMKD